MLRRLFFTFMVLCVPVVLEAKPPEIDAQGVKRKLGEIMQAHASTKQLDPAVVKRALTNYLEVLDPSKAYFIKTDIQKWSDPSDQLVAQILKDYQNANYNEFTSIHDAMVKAIERRRKLEKAITVDQLPKKVDRKEFKDADWVADQAGLVDRLRKIKALQREVADKLPADVKEKAMERIEKYQRRYEDEIMTTDAVKKRQTVYSNVLKATASAFDSHTNYFTPDEAKQFLIGVQQRLFGIGAQLRDDITGLTVVKIVDGGPAFRGGKLKAKDRIIAVDGEPVVGMDITDAVELIRGDLGTFVTLTVIREDPTENGGKEKKVDVIVERGEVVLTEARYESGVEPFGDGVIAYLRLHTFYQDPEHSSSVDLDRELQRLKKENNVKGVVLDLRSNSGGLLAPAVSVAGLFITKGVVVSIKDETGRVQHLRDLDGKVSWDGPLVVLINRGTASSAEIVAQALKDYGRAIIVGDDHSYGKGSFQTFTVQGGQENQVNPEGEYKVTRGRYYTVSGHTPQRVGVASDIIVPSALSFAEVGEKFLKNPLEPDQIEPNFDDKLMDIPLMQRARVSKLYLYDLQAKLDIYDKYLPKLKKNSEVRIANNKGYQAFIKDIESKEKDKDLEDDSLDRLVQSDFQLNEGYNIMRDLIIFMGQAN
ncbi:MAG: S41 family peptidase [Chlamydiales bacterium]|nr:S41 family peptidase [Chlamydiales bacterium]